VFYWLSNITGILLMYAAGKKIVQEGEHPIKKLITLFINIAVYSVILIIIYKIGLLKPISLPLLK
jgi:hypothetical protein